MAEIELTDHGARVSAELTVWAEGFTTAECAFLANLLHGVRRFQKFEGEFLPPEQAAALERVEDMFRALTNDSDACIVHQKG